MKRALKNIPASVWARLKNKTEETNRPFSEILQYYGMERFLYRFSQSQYADKFILKGALMFTVWQVPERRTTLDIDFSARFDKQIASIEKVIKDVCKVPVVSDSHRKTSLPEDKPLFAEEIYDEKSDRQMLWKAFLQRSDIKHAPENLRTTARDIEKFLIKPLDAINKGQGFNKEWKALGPWA